MGVMVQNKVARFYGPRCMLARPRPGFFAPMTLGKFGYGYLFVLTAPMRAWRCVRSTGCDRIPILFL